MKSLQKQVHKFHHWIFKIFNFTHNVSKFYIFRCDLVNLFASILFFFLFILRSSNKNKACEKAIKAFELRAPVSVHAHHICPPVLITYTTTLHLARWRQLCTSFRKIVFRTLSISFQTDDCDFIFTHIY